MTRQTKAVSRAVIVGCVVLALFFVPVVPTSPQQLELCTPPGCNQGSPMSASASVTWAVFHVGAVYVVSLGTFKQYCWVEGANLSNSCIAWHSFRIR